MITRLLQFLLIAATFAGLIVFGLIRDKREHASTAEPDEQPSLPFPTSKSPDHEHRGAAMSRL